MALVSKITANLIGGVSQQPDALRFDNQCEASDNAYPSVLEGLVKRQPAEFVAVLGAVSDPDPSDWFVHTINRDKNERYFFTLQSTEESATPLVSTITGESVVVNLPSGSDYLTMPDADTKPDTTIRAITIADFTFLVNKTITPQMEPTTVTERTHEAMFFVRQGDYGTNYKITINDDIYTVTTPDGSDASDRNAIDTNAIATQLAGQIQAGYNAVAIGSTVYVSDSAPFDVSGSDGLGGLGLVVIKDNVQNITDLPLEGRDGFITKVVGSPSDPRDDYWVTFVADSGGDGSGFWEETRDPLVDYRLAPATMPHVLIRQSNGEFRLTPCDGSTYTVDDVDFTVPEWGERNVGDKDSNADPSFVGRPINDIFLFKNRLGLLAGENVVLSESAEFFNFWRTTVASLLDTAPIDVASTNASVSNLTSAIPFANVLVLFSDTVQFMLQSNGALSPRTVAMVKTTSFESISDVRPLTLGNSIYFGFDRGDYTGMQQYYLAADTEDVFEATDIAEHVPQYIKGSLRDTAGSAYEKVLFCLTDEDRSSLYFYTYHDSGVKRVQSAWSRFTFSQGTDIIGIEFINTTLYIISLRDSLLCVDKIRMETGLVDTGSTYRTHLDRRVDQSQCTVAETSITLPYPIASGSAVEVITKAGRRIPVTSQAEGSPDIEVASSVEGVEFWAGVPYTMAYTISDIVMRDANNSGVETLPAEARAQIRYMTTNFSGTSYFRVKVSPDLGDDYEYPYTARTLGDGDNIIGVVPVETGSFRIPVYCERDRATIQIINDTPLPSSITNLEYELSINARSVRYN